MKTNNTLRHAARLGAALLLAQAALASSGSAQLTIVRNFTGGSPPGNLAGGGDLEVLFNLAADEWERSFCTPTAHTVTISFRWASLGGSTLGSHTLLSQGGFPNRETSGRITFDNDGSSVFFADSTPSDPNEFGLFVENQLDLGGGSINVGRVHGGSTGAASGRIDLFSVVRHEIGHALGLSSANSSFAAEAGADKDVDVVAPLPAAGSVIPTDPGGSAHVDLFRTLMFPSVSNGRRNDITDADILANAEISKFQAVFLGIPPQASSAIRNGSGVNPMGYVEVNPAVIGKTWDTTVDLSGGAANSIVFVGLAGPTQVMVNSGELLCAGPHMVASIAPGVHSTPIPNDCFFIGITVPTQAATLHPGPIQLQNAIDITIGSY